ncbi:MAG: TetR/AcrR family transcriptional regulator [Gemmatimonadaceae bacterium]|nr:TetR/AcrR family transcriptional regulator [Gemmatimonadaceae bacterium]
MSNRRASILDAAAELIAEKGYAQTSVDDIIKKADLSGKSHFYHYFKSKEELGYQVLTRQFDLLAERGLAILREPTLAPLERLNLFIDSVVALQAERGLKGGSPFGILATEMAEQDEGFRVRIAQVFRGWSREIEGLLAQVRPQFGDDVSPQRLARFVIATLEGATVMARMKRDVGIMHGIAVDLKRFVASHLRQPTGSF